MHFLSHDANDVERVWQEYVPTAELREISRDGFRFRWDSYDADGVSLVDYDLRADVHSVVEPEDQLMACRVAGPTARVGSRRQELDATQPWLTDGAQVSATWADARVKALIFDRKQAIATARQALVDDEFVIHVQSLQPTSRADAAHWERTFDYLERTFASISPSDELVQATLRDHALFTTLATFSTNFREAAARTHQNREASRTVRRALAFIDENAHRPITLVDIAAAVHMSSRGLQYAFRRSLDTTPSAALRRARLDGARRDILTGAEERVSSIALRWGFTNVSRFATAYREAYGEHPAVTAARTRG